MVVPPTSCGIGFSADPASADSLLAVSALVGGFTGRLGSADGRARSQDDTLLVRTVASTSDFGRASQKWT
jgi:hypothetical protein